MYGNLYLLDWMTIGLFLAMSVFIGLYFSRRAGRNIQSFFVSDRSLPWVLSGISMLATSFASDTPLWVTTLVREKGIHYVWQYWASAIGGTLGLVLFARWWRRLGVITDIEMIELRYHGRGGACLRGWSATSTALLFCPLIIGWVTKAMEVITREAIGLPPQYRALTTVFVVLLALGSCALSGLWGVVYTDFVQFFLAVVGTTALAFLSVQRVGGLGAMVEQLRNLQDWVGQDLSLAPKVGTQPGDMSFWNFVGFFMIAWIQLGYAGGFAAQRLLASKNGRHASFAMLTLSLLYFGVICWPWILVGLCSLILLPDLGAGFNSDAAYPRMAIMLLPAGLRGIMLAALLAAFMSTITTLFNWGASYLVNDVYKRFLIRDAADHHYVTVGRLATVLMAVTGGAISFAGNNILQLVYIAFLLWSPLAILGIMRWLWWRQNAWGEFAASIAAYGMAILILFGRVFDAPAKALGIDGALSSDVNLVGLRMLIVTITVIVVSVAVSLLTRPTSRSVLTNFIHRAKPFPALWAPVIVNAGIAHYATESVARTLCSWFLALVGVLSLSMGLGCLIIGNTAWGLSLVLVCVVTLWLTVRRINQDFRDETEGSLDSSGKKA